MFIFNAFVCKSRITQIKAASIIKCYHCLDNDSLVKVWLSNLPSLGRPAYSQNNSRFHSLKQNFKYNLDLTSILRSEVAHESTRAVCK